MHVSRLIGSPLCCFKTFLSGQHEENTLEKRSGPFPALNLRNADENALSKALQRPKSLRAIVGLPPNPKNLSEAILLLSQPRSNVKFWGVAFKALEKLVKKNPSDLDAVLWLGVCVRMGGGDGRPYFQRVLSCRPNDRLATLNFAANVLSENTIDFMTVRQRVIESRLLVEEYLKRNSSDAYGHLILRLLWNRDERRMIDVLPSLEEMSKNFPSYSSLCSSIASIYASELVSEGANYWAQKAIEGDRSNLQARSIACNNDEDKKFIDKALKEMRVSGQFKAKPYIGGIEFVLYAPYEQQDPGFN